MRMAMKERVERNLGEFPQRCREAGAKATPQRLAIYRALLDSEDHPGPEGLYQRVRAAMPSMSLATVYKSLDALVRMGLVKEVSVMADGKRYEANLERHHHFICTRCKKIADVYDATLDRVAAPGRRGGFVVNEVSVQLIGLCAVCAGQPRH